MDIPQKGTVEQTLLNLNNLLIEYKKLLVLLQKKSPYKYNPYYVEKEENLLVKINADFRKLKHYTQTSNNSPFSDKLSIYYTDFEQIIGGKLALVKRFELIGKILIAFPEFTLSLPDRQSSENRPILPTGITDSEVIDDLQEAIDSNEHNCPYASLVMSRRAYETALSIKYEQLEKKMAIEDVVCPHCKILIQKNKPIGITKLHRWAVQKGIITKRLEQIGYLVPGLGAGGAHYCEDKLARNKGIAKISLTIAIELISTLYK